jgi:hypothetical protein
MKDNVENVCSSSTNPKNYTIAIFANLKISEMNALRCGKPLMFSKAMSKDWHEMELPLLQQHYTSW